MFISDIFLFRVDFAADWRGGNSLTHKILALAAATAIYIAAQFLMSQIHISEDYSFIIKIVYLVFINGIKLILGMCGIGIAFVTTRMILQSGRKLPENIITLSTYCYGVYIFHQFILRYLYYHTAASVNILPYCLPWVAFASTLVLSLTITALFLKTKIGKFLIG